MTTSGAKVIFLLGPTASGKTALAFRLVDHFATRRPLEIISVDSALVYRGMNIGTAKPDAATLQQYPHRLIDLIDPPEAYSAARFCVDANAAIADALARGRTPLLVGGTMLYAKALLEGISDMPAADAGVRRQLETLLAGEGLAALYAELQRVDAVTAARLHPTDTQRIQRALEVYRLSGTPISQLQTRGQEQGPAAFAHASLLIGLAPGERAALHGRIAARFDAMLEAGLLDEVRLLRRRYALDPDMPSMRAVGYRQAWQYLEGGIDAAALRETALAATRQLAKRQLTWLRSMPAAEMFDCLREDLAQAVQQRVAVFLERGSAD
ncbi:MAG TPA: tRNA (adenosine(37)-N6)-dimethylallyltransferase MiaA [Usitatibacteraceae bacterium]